MKIIQPKVSLWIQHDKVAHVACCARVCYGREQGNNNALYDSLEKRNHLSMYRHETYYSAFPVKGKDDLIYYALNGYLYNPYIKYITYKDYCYIITNGHFLRDIQKINPFLYNSIYNYQITSEEAEQIEPIWKHFMRYTFYVTTQISTSRELNRVSPNNIAEQSTRYVYEDGTICKPHWLEGYKISKGLKGGLYVYKDENTEIEMNNKVRLYIEDCERSFNTYKELIDAGLSRQDARGVLPLDTATKCVYTYSIEEWRKIIDLRYYGTTGKPHPNAKIAAGMIREQLIELGYDFR